MACSVVLRSLQIENKDEYRKPTSVNRPSFGGIGVDVRRGFGSIMVTVLKIVIFFNAKSCRKNDVLLKIVQSLKNLYSVGFEKKPKWSWLEVKCS